MCVFVCLSVCLPLIPIVHVLVAAQLKELSEPVAREYGQRLADLARAKVKDNAR